MLLALVAPAGLAWAGEPSSAAACAPDDCWQPRLSVSLRSQSPAAPSMLPQFRVRTAAPEARQTPVAIRLGGMGLARQFDRDERQTVALVDRAGAWLALSALTFTEQGVAFEPAQARVLAPRLSVGGEGAGRFLDVDYTAAHYALPAPGVASYRLRQFAPSVGFALTGRQDWLTLRFYDVRTPDAARALTAPLRTRALEAKWVRHLDGAAGGPDQVQVSTLMGNRIHAVDPDGAALFSLADIQTGGLSVGASWAVSPHVKWMVNGGYDRFEQGGPGGPEYGSTYVFTGVKGRW